MEITAPRLTRAALLLGLIAIGFLAARAPANAASVGDVAPDFELTTQDGVEFRMADYRGRKPVYVIFWNTWCSYCIKKIPRYQKLRSFKEQHDISYLTAFDDGESVTDQYQVFKVPTEFIVDINGIIRYRDGLPEYLVAHLPDWIVPHVPSRDNAQQARKK